jgi:hypothetical protein
MVTYAVEQSPGRGTYLLRLRVGLETPVTYPQPSEQDCVSLAEMWYPGATRVPAPIFRSFIASSEVQC